MEFRNSQLDNELLKEKETEMAAAQNVRATEYLTSIIALMFNFITVFHENFHFCLSGKYCAYFADDGKNSCELHSVLI